MRRVEGPEVVAAETKSFTGQYLRPLLERSSRSPAEAGVQAAKPRRRPEQSLGALTRNSRAWLR